MLFHLRCDEEVHAQYCPFDSLRSLIFLAIYLLRADIRLALNALEGYPLRVSLQQIGVARRGYFVYRRVLALAVFE